MKTVENLLEGCEVLFIQTILNEELHFSDPVVTKEEKYWKSCKMMENSVEEEEEEEIQQTEKEKYET